MKAPVKVGILGGGQLSRMLVTAAMKLSLRPFIFADKKSDCAVQVCSDVIYSDGSLETLAHFCKAVDLVIIENEFVNLERLKAALGSTPLYPGIDCLKLVQNKLRQKENLKNRGLNTLEFSEVKSRRDLTLAIEKLGPHIVLKRALFGYDGKGTFIFDEKRKLDPEAFFALEPDFDGYAEPKVAFVKELAVIVARGIDGKTVAFPVVETNQEGGICRWVMAPPDINSHTASEAAKLGKQVIESFGGTGVFGIEMFLLEGDKIVINEIAPRVHNSGHYTMDVCKVDQFQMHLRAVTGMPISDEKIQCPGVAMVNILGRKSETIQDIQLPPRTKTPTELSPEELSPDGLSPNRLSNEYWIHWYGKTGACAGRKLGHINATGRTASSALKKALAIRDTILI